MTKELRLQCRLSNNRLYRARLAAGLKVKDLCEKARVLPYVYSHLLDLRMSARLKSGTRRPSAVRLARCLKVAFDTLFPFELSMIKEPLVEREFDAAEILPQLVEGEHYAGPPLLPAAYVEQQELSAAVEAALSTISPHERMVLEQRFGIGTEEKTLDEIAEHAGVIPDHLAVSRERVRQIEAKALRKLRHPSRSKHLRPFMTRTPGTPGLYRTNGVDDDA
jgi:RNA polymerase sigma factor (sigma-70 family)